MFRRGGKQAESELLVTAWQQQLSVSAIQIKSECRASTVGVRNSMNTTHNTDPFPSSVSLANCRGGEGKAGTLAKLLGLGLKRLGTEKRSIMERRNGAAA